MQKGKISPIETLWEGITDHDWAYIRATVRQKLTPKYRQAGTMKGMFNMADDFDAPLEDMKEYM
jgi:Protein of unknown function (DUF2281)